MSEQTNSTRTSDENFSTGNVREMFFRMRHNASFHLGLGDIRLTMADQLAIASRLEHAELAARTNAEGWKEALEELRKLERDTSRAPSNHLDDLNEDWS